MTTEKKNPYPCPVYVYRIYWPENDDSYVGSTSDIKKRMQRHKKDGRDPYMLVSKKIKGLDGYFEHEIIDTLWCKNKRDALEREREWQDVLDPSLNEKRAFRTKEEKKEQNAEYYQNNKERVKELGAAWYQNNKKRKNELGAAYYQNNKKRMKEYSAAWNQNNKERMKELNSAWHQKNKVSVNERKAAYRAIPENKERISERITCECGSEVRRDSLSRHKKSKKHKLFMDNSKTPASLRST